MSYRVNTFRVVVYYLVLFGLIWFIFFVLFLLVC